MNFPIRFDKIEANITGGPYDNIDTTSIDYFSIPIQATSYLGTKQVYQLKAQFRDPDQERTRCLD